jgi:hypothetical protein
MKSIRDIVVANILTISIIATLAWFTTVEVKRELFFNGSSKTQYRLRIGR